MYGRVAGWRWLAVGVVLLFCPMALAANPSLAAGPSHDAQPQGSAQPDATPHPRLPRKTLHDRLLAAEKALAFAGNEKEAQRISDRAEELRSRALTGAVRLLVSDAQEALQKHDFQSAEDNLTAAITLQPDQPVLRRIRAAARLNAGDNNGAIIDLGVTLDADPGDPEAWSLLAEAERERHEPDAALRAYRQALLLNPKIFHGDEQLKTLQKDVDGQSD